MRDSDPVSRLHHDLRHALSAVQMNLQILATLGSRGEEVSEDRRTAIIGRASDALSQAVEIADRLRTVQETQSPPQ